MQEMGVLVVKEPLQQELEVMVAMISKMLLLLSTAMLLITRADFILKGTVISNDFLVL